MVDIPDGHVGLNDPSCSCSIRVHEDGPVAIHFCPLHAAAPQMLEALVAVSYWSLFDRTETGYSEDVLPLVERAIAAARGERKETDDGKGRDVRD